MTTDAPGPRRRVSVVGVAGEVLVTLGVIVGLFFVWQLWINDWISDAGQASTARSYAREWAAESPAAPQPTATEGTGETELPAVATDPPVTATPAAREVFANLIVPRFGDDFSRPIAEGVGTDVLDNTDLGMGHYTATEMPGAVGNVAIASHRTAYGGALHLLPELRLGDPVYLETADGWYEYRYRNTEYVLASGVGVLDDVPQSPGAPAADRLLTMTTCNPIYSSAERIIAYAVFDRFYPRADGPPADIAAVAEGD